MATGEGVNVSKFNMYAVLSAMPGISTSKVIAYAVLGSKNLVPPIWPSFSFHDGILGNAYRQDFDLYPAAGPITFSITDGVAPTGLTLYIPLSGTIAELIGTPTVIGVYTFTLRATNAYGYSDKQFTVTISDPIVLQGGGQASFF